MDEFQKDQNEWKLSFEEAPLTKEEFSKDNELFTEREFQQSKDTSQKRKSKRERFKNSLMQQAASVIAAAVVVTSAFGLDILKADAFFGGGLSSSTLDSELNKNDAREGIITVSMLWTTEDDLDLHVITPSGEEIYFGNRSAGGGELDLDMQVSDPFVSRPVENIYFDEPAHGTYQVYVHTYTKRSSGSVPVLVRVSIKGEKAKEYSITSDEWVEVCRFTY